MVRKLNTKQIVTLKIALKFRYLTTDNLATYKNITQNSAYSTLQILHTNGYLGMIYHKSYHLLNKSARYHVTQQGITFLRKEVPDISSALWISRKNEAKKSADFIDLHVSIHAAGNRLRARLGDTIQLFTTLEFYDIEGMIKPLPSLLVRTVASKQYTLVEITDGQHLFLVKKRIRKYLQNYEEGDWDWDWAKYPDVYIVRSSSSDRARLRKYVEDQMENSYLDEEDFSIHIVSKVELIKMKGEV